MILMWPVRVLTIILQCSWMSKVSMVHKSWLYHKCTLCYVCRSLCTSPWIVGCQLTLLIFLPMARFSSVKVHWSFRPSETITNWSEASAPMPKALKSSVNTFIMCACWRACKTLQSENVPVEIWTGTFYVSLLTDSGANRQTNKRCWKHFFSLASAEE